MLHTDRCDKCGETTTDIDAGFCPSELGLRCGCGGRWQKTIRLGELNEVVRRHERQLAPGSETPILGYYNERMRVVCGQIGVCAKNENVHVPQNEADWWERAYLLYIQETADKQITDIQDIFNLV